MAARFDYPAESWAKGKMRKRGDQFAKMERQLPGQGGSLADMERAAGMGISARGGQTGTFQMPGVEQPARIGGDLIAQQKGDLAEAQEAVAKGEITQDWFNKLLKKYGWTKSSEEGKFRDPDGNDHAFGEARREEEVPIMGVGRY